MTRDARGTSVHNPKAALSEHPASLSYQRGGDLQVTRTSGRWSGELLHLRVAEELALLSILIVLLSSERFLFTHL